MNFQVPNSDLCATVTLAYVNRHSRRRWPIPKLGTVVLQIVRILIAEDDTALAGFVRKGLEAEHYAVDVSLDGEQARALATELNYDLLILDLNLPRLDGLTILKEV